MYLFKNIVRNGATGSHLLRVSQATFVDVLNDDYAKEHFLALVQSKTKVHGTLKTKNAFTPPFHKICTNCNKKIPDNLADCIICKQNTLFRPEHCLECTLETEDGVFNCTMKFPQLQQCCPAVALTTQEQYRNNISSTVFHLRRLSVQGVFVLDAYNTITEITITQ